MLTSAYPNKCKQTGRNANSDDVDVTTYVTFKAKCETCVVRACAGSRVGRVCCIDADVADEICHVCPNRQ